MKRLYLLGFVRHCDELPFKAPMPTALTTVEEHSVIWCRSPGEIFITKQDFLTAMLQLFDQLRQHQLTVLPIQSGISIVDEDYLMALLETYKSELGRSFDKVEGCSEFFVTLVLKDQKFVDQSSPSKNLSPKGGMEYIEQMRVRHQLKKQETEEVHTTVAYLCRRLTPWIKDIWYEIPKTRQLGINLGILVPDKFEQEFLQELNRLTNEGKFLGQWTGPWPPFHFSSFELKPESFLLRESLVWDKGVGS